MQIIGMQDPSKGPNTFSTGVASRGGIVILHNLSPYDLLLTFNNDATRQVTLMAWQPREFDFCGQQTSSVSYAFLYAPATTQINAPSSIIIGEAYAPGEKPPISHPNYDRLSNLGNQILPTASTQSVINDGNSPPTTVLEATPNDQSQSAVVISNDGSAQWSILSAGVIRSLLSVVRGTIGPVEAQVVIGDASDPTMTVLHGQADTAAQAGQAQTANLAQASNTLNVYDGGTGNIKSVTHYESVTDPSTYITPADGDIWYQG